jgi:membrane protease YdiL (CAAX protease family)
VRRCRPPASLLAALCVAVAVWILLLVGALAASALGEWATLAAVAGATLLLLATRPPGRRRAGPGALLAAAAGGAASLPLGLSLSSVLGATLGLELPALAPRPAGAPRVVCDLALGPLLEEALYRERLLPALRAALGAPLALGASSLLFALAHRDPWLALAAFGVGAALGALWLATQSLGLCVAAHAGLNLAAFALARAAGAPGP